MQAVSQDHNMWTQKDKKRGEESGEAAGKIKIHGIMKKGWQEERRSEKKGKERERVREEERKERIEEMMLNARQEKRKTALTRYILERVQLSLEQYRSGLHGSPYTQIFLVRTYIQDDTICGWLSLRLQNRGFRGPWSIY